jgi:hypothetical protein
VVLALDAAQSNSSMPLSGGLTRPSACLKASTSVRTKPEFGWIVLRHVRTLTDEALWRENLRRIRMHFPCDPILVIDNRSNRTMHPATDTSCGAEYEPCMVTVYDAIAAGEYLPYHLMHTLRPFDRAVYLMDSALLVPHPKSVIGVARSAHDASIMQRVQNGRRQLATPGTIQPLFSFPSWSGLYGPDAMRDANLGKAVRAIIGRLSNASSIRRRLTNYTAWAGIFGAMAAFDLAFADMLENELGLSRVLNDSPDRPVSSDEGAYGPARYTNLPEARDKEGHRNGRAAWERVLGIIASFGGGSPATSPQWPSQMPAALLGDIHESTPCARHLKCNCGDVINGIVQPARDDVFILKCWEGR